MDDLRAQLAESYSGHPAFAFDEKPLEADAVALAAFSEPLEAIRSSVAESSITGARAAAERCRDAIDSIFSALSAQTSDVAEHQFLFELKSECTRRMFSELAFCATRRARSDVDADPTLAALRAKRYAIGTLSPRSTEALCAATAPAAARLRALANEGRVDRGDLSV